MGNTAHRLQQGLDAGFTEIFGARRAERDASSQARAAAWSSPQHGVQTLNANHCPHTWASVWVYPGAAKCYVFTPGCGLRPAITWHPTAAAAREHGERELARLAGGSR